MKLNVVSKTDHEMEIEVHGENETLLNPIKQALLNDNARRIAAHLIANTEPDDTIWVWGWHLWDVYPLTNKLAGSRIYKSLGILSQPHDDAWRRQATPLRFVDSEYATLLLADLDANRPAYVVLGSTVPHREFVELHELLRAHYRRDHRLRIGKVQFWRLRE